MRLKHGERSDGDCMISKQDFRALEKLKHRPSDGMEPMGRMKGCGCPLAVDGQSVISGIRTG